MARASGVWQIILAWLWRSVLALFRAFSPVFCWGFWSFFVLAFISISLAFRLVFGLSTQNIFRPPKKCKVGSKKRAYTISVFGV